MKQIKNKGFSLIEILVTIAIIGILAGIAIPNYTKYQNKARDNVLETTAQQILNSYQVCMSLDTLDNCNGVGAAKLNISLPRGYASKGDHGNVGTCFSVWEDNGAKKGTHDGDERIACALAENNGKVRPAINIQSEICTSITAGNPPTGCEK